MKGFTLIEFLIVLAILSILAAVLFGESTSTKCVAGYQHVFNAVTGNLTQVIDSNGAGIPCVER